MWKETVKETVREYDADGNLIKETIREETTTDDGIDPMKEVPAQNSDLLRWAIPTAVQ